MTVTQVDLSNTGINRAVGTIATVAVRLTTCKVVECVPASVEPLARAIDGDQVYARAVICQLVAHTTEVQVDSSMHCVPWT